MYCIFEHCFQWILAAKSIYIYISIDIKADDVDNVRLLVFYSVSIFLFHHNHQLLLYFPVLVLWPHTDRILGADQSPIHKSLRPSKFT